MVPEEEYDAPDSYRNKKNEPSLSHIIHRTQTLVKKYFTITEADIKKEAEQARREKDITDAVEATVKEMWGKFDRDRSGSLTKAEVQDFFLQNGGPFLQLDPSLTSSMVQELFDEFDTNYDGIITRTEMRRILRATFKALAAKTK